MFLHLSVSHSASVHAGIPPRSSPPPQPRCMLGDTVNKQAVRILLECNLVSVLNLLFWRTEFGGGEVLELSLDHILISYTDITLDLQ